MTKQIFPSIVVGAVIGGQIPQTGNVSSNQIASRCGGQDNVQRSVKILTLSALLLAMSMFSLLGVSLANDSLANDSLPAASVAAEDVAAENSSAGMTVEATSGVPPFPHMVIESITNEVVALIAQYRESERGVLAAETSAKAAEDERFKQFVGEVDTAMMKAIDFDWIALNVMGPYRKTATEVQKQEFARIFKAGLVETYGRGLLNYGDEKIVLVSPIESPGEKRKATVVQEIRNAEGRYPLEYSMGLNREGEWKVVNVVINGINLGKTFRNQFVQAAQQNAGDIDKVITNWDASES
ncbi:MAG: ABC transporter substrate-binding protein [Porticoccaceae bacterium]|nr:ABC transporter substrate-binding protein [Porticoccaceae bacterium]